MWCALKRASASRRGKTRRRGQPWGVYQKRGQHGRLLLELPLSSTPVVLRQNTTLAFSGRISQLQTPLPPGSLLSASVLFLSLGSCPLLHDRLAPTATRQQWCAPPFVTTVRT